MHMYSTPWMSPGCMCLTGTDKSEKEEKHIIVVYEWPMITVNFSEKLTKYEKECLHLDRVITDANLSLGTVRPDKYEAGEDPPDFMIHRNGTVEGVDLVQFTFKKRRRANAIFEKLKEEIYKCEPKTFTHLSGSIVYIDFGRNGKRGKAIPFTNKENEYLDRFIAELSQFQIDRKKWEHGELSEKPPELNNGQSEGGVGFLVAPLRNSVPATNFFYRMGFELGLAFYTRLSVSDAWQEIVSRVDSHDKSCIDELLISAGAPNESGVSFLSDEALILHALENPPIANPITPKNIKNVIVHLWSTGAIWEIYPSYKEITSGIYKGITPLHHAINIKKP